MEKLLTASEVMEILQIKRTALWNLDKKGKLCPIRINARLVRYREEDVRRLLQ